jgi:tetratricopeptide (TPR) repeat protein
LGRCFIVRNCDKEREGRAELANNLATALNNHGRVLLALGRLAEAEACQRENLAIRRRLVEQEGRAELANDLAAALNNHGDVLQDLGRLAEAEACQRESGAILRRLVKQ